MAALRKHSDIAFGNIVGSNIYNVLGILGVTAIIKPIDVPPQIASLDIWVMIAASVLLFITATSRWRIGRVEGGMMIAGYVGYCVWLGMNSAA
jgi:cation:H+ antiporter